MTYEIIYNNEVIDTAETTHEACDLVKEYRAAFKSLNVQYKRGDLKWTSFVEIAQTKILV